MNYQRSWINFLFLSLIILIPACITTSGSNNGITTAVQDIEQVIEKSIDDLMTEENGLEQQEISDPVGLKFQILTKNNISELKETKVIYPFFLPYLDVSDDGKIAAIGNLSGINIVDLNDGKLWDQMETHLPDCRYGMDRYFQLSKDGNRIVVANTDAIQVWEVGGDKLYENAYNKIGQNNNLICGLDIPQITLSPDGKYMAESGISRSDEDIGKYFSIIDIDNGDTVYTWNGEDNRLHGKLYGFDGLGFSADGKVLHTFDPTRYKIDSDDFQSAFRFWSVTDHVELGRNSSQVRNSFEPGKLLFSLSTEDSLTVFSKVDGKIVAKFSMSGCSYTNPCRTVFSPDGSKVLVLSNQDAQFYKRETVSTKGYIFDIKTSELIDETEFTLRNTEGVQVENNGTVITPTEDVMGMQTEWWTHTDYFSGFQIDINDVIMFTPQVVDVFQSEPTFTGTCVLLLDEWTTACEPTMVLANAARLHIVPIDEGYKVYSVEGDSEILFTEIRNPNNGTSGVWRLRFLEYADQAGVAFFCLDFNGRAETCMIVDVQEDLILEEGLDLHKFVFSIALQRAAFIDRGRKSLVIYDPAADRLKPMSSYRATAYPVKPQFINGTDELLYIVQSIDSKRIYIEQINVLTEKVIKRFDIEALEQLPVTALTVAPSADIWAVGDENGKVYFRKGGTIGIYETREKRTRCRI